VHIWNNKGIKRVY